MSTSKLNATWTACHYSFVVQNFLRGQSAVLVKLFLPAYMTLRRDRCICRWAHSRYSPLRNVVRPLTSLSSSTDVSGACCNLILIRVKALHWATPSPSQSLTLRSDSSTRHVLGEHPISEATIRALTTANWILRFDWMTTEIGPDGVAASRTCRWNRGVFTPQIMLSGSILA